MAYRLSIVYNAYGYVVARIIYLPAREYRVLLLVIRRTPKYQNFKILNYSILYDL